MGADDSPDDPATGDDEPTTARERLERGADRAIAGFDEGVVDLLSWLLDTETRGLIYVYLRSHPDSTGDEVAEGTDRYPSTVREALADLHADDTVTRRKRERGGAGNNPYEYRAIPPADLVRGLAGEVQAGLNAVVTLDDRLGGDGTDADGPVRITVEEGED